MNLRYYQKECRDAVLENAQSGKKANLCVEPTGAGKSAIMAAIAQKLLKKYPGKKVLFVSHRKELDKQNSEAFLAINPDKSIGFEKAEAICPQEADAMFASILSVGKTGIPRIRRWANPKDIAAIFFDEAHHLAGGKTYQTLLHEVQNENPNVLVVGLTATPERADGEQIGDYLPHIAHQIDIEELIQAGYLANLKGVSVSTNCDLQDIKSHRGDFTENDLADRVDTEERNAMAARLYNENHKGEKAMAFAVNKAHAASLTKAFELQGVKTACITEDTPKEERDTLKERIRSGEVDAVISIGCLTEGFDLPELKAIFALRPTKSPTLLAQMLGRGLRLIVEPDPKNPGEHIVRNDLKSHCVVYDFVDLHAKEAGAKRIGEMTGISQEVNITLTGEDLPILGDLTRMVGMNPLAAANLAQAKTKEEIQTLLLPIDILARIKKYKPRKDTNLPWTPGPEDSHYLALCKGELCQLARDPRGIFVLHTPELKLQERETQQAHFQKREARPKNNTPAQKIDLRAKTLPAAFAEATLLLRPALQYDINILASDAPWKKAASKERATEKQRAALEKRGILTPEELKKISKKDASNLLTLCEVKERTLLTLKKAPSGRYEGVDLAELALRKPGYLKKCLDKNLARAWGAETAIKPALQSPPFDWLEKNRRGLYKTKIEPNRQQFEQDWKSDPETTRKRLIEILDLDPTKNWKAMEEIAQKRTDIFAERALQTRKAFRTK